MAILDTPEQVELERCALTALEHPDLMRARDQVRDLYRADHIGQQPDGAATIDQASAAIAMAAVQCAIAEVDPVARFMWVANAAHEWHGLAVPASGYGIDNPDNVHRHTTIDPDASYRLTGTPNGGSPAQQSFILYAAMPGLGELTKEGAEIVDAVVLEENTAGEYTLTIGPEPSDDPLHLCTRGRGTFLLSRNALANWETQRPVTLAVTRTSDAEPHRTDLDADRVAVRAAEMLPQMARFWVDYDNAYLWSRPMNTFTAPRVRPFGAASSSSFQIDSGQCLAFTVRMCGASYLGVEVTDPWGVTHEYVDGTGSLNNNQVLANDDGSITCLVAAADPGAHNWLDTRGLGLGMVTIRWQGLDADADLGDAVTDCRTVALAEVPGVVADQLVTPDERAEQLRLRRRSYGNRL